MVRGGSNAIAVQGSVAQLDPLWSAAARCLGAGILLVAGVLATTARSGSAYPPDPARAAPVRMCGAA